ncbi:hypothetical protein [Prauserella endophytica]|uniref:YbaB/EbfC family DNA-binding protein n=1 Tax=Prauserella endophytica TaxID=1592324 RepID=A0ABY2SC14_9PSEU|nr:hypothetical protein [Prauserella endophytica]TKG73375.1 hypothetical protein FCN18_02015 [Prauserella endophytica]
MTELDEARNRMAQAGKRRAEADAKIIGEKIEHRLGVVQVDICGSLRAIELDHRLLPELAEERVAELVTAAVHRAERKAGELREIVLGADPMREEDEC